MIFVHQPVDERAADDLATALAAQIGREG